MIPLADVCTAGGAQLKGTTFGGTANIHEPIFVPRDLTSRFSLVDVPQPDDEPDHARMMGDMAQIVAHRIRGLVTTIEGFTDLLTDTLSSREQRELALRIFESASRIESVLADLQMFARPVRPVQIRVSVREILDDIEAAVSDDIARRLSLDRSDFEWAVLADRMLVRQALLVLLQNAADASDDTQPIYLGCDHDDSHVRIHVVNCAALHPEVEENAFKPFFTTKAHNLGVGLPIAARIARSHGGSIDLAYSDPDRGTCFALILPRDRAGEVAR